MENFKLKAWATQNEFKYTLDNFVRNCLEVKSKKRVVDCSSCIRPEAPILLKGTKKQDPTDLVSGMSSVLQNGSYVLMW